MRNVLGGLLVAVGIGVGLYVGVWLMFIGGIVQVMDTIRAPELSAREVASGVARVVFAGLVGGFAAMSCVVPGFLLVSPGR